MEQSEQLYIKGFNRGYVITKYLPDLSASILNNIGTTNDFIEGFSSGKHEYEMEKTRTQLNELDELRNKPEERNIDLERD
jgi:hypothetical protein